MDDTWQLDPHVNVTFFSPISLSLQPFRLLGVVDASAQALLLADESQFSSPTGSTVTGGPKACRAQQVLQPVLQGREGAEVVGATGTYTSSAELLMTGVERSENATMGC